MTVVSASIHRDHDCPGGCGAPVSWRRFSCTTCWRRLPVALKQPILDNYKVRPLEHLRAMSSARRWYRENR